MRCRNSLSSREFSIAITAWLAKLFNSAICFSLNGATSRRSDSDGADQFAVLEHRNDENGARARKVDEVPGWRVGVGVKLGGAEIGRVRKLPGPHQLAEYAVRSARENFLPGGEKFRRTL